MVHKWTLAFILFFIFYNGFRQTTYWGRDAFDPSGHLSAGLIMLNCHYSPCSFFQSKMDQLAKMKFRDTENQSDHQKLNKIAGVMYMIYLAFLIHTTYSLFWTVMIFHSFIDSVVGILFGVFISLTVFQTDTFSDALSYLIDTLKGEA